MLHLNHGIHLQIVMEILAENNPDGQMNAHS